ncbi:HAD-IA family hydrolase [Actinoplanes sp. NPDC023714]|uniref:HAD-IA family hydrolase n=1 Tax=Actinoplanes sp. NPDC023714 TaxID=3154322 RepID=UPI00340BF8C4
MARWTIGPVTAALFDLDGVLVDSMAAIDWCMRTWAVERGLDPDHVIALSHGRRDTDILALALPGTDPGPELDRIAELDVAALPKVRAVPGAADLLNVLEPGSWAVVTSGAAGIARARIEAAGLPVPDLMITADDVLAGKPDPQGYLLAAEKLGVLPRHCVVFEDAEVGLLAAARAGAHRIQVGGGAPAVPLSDGWVADLTGVRAAVEGDRILFSGR